VCVYHVEECIDFCVREGGTGEMVVVVVVVGGWVGQEGWKAGSKHMQCNISDSHLLMRVGRGQPSRRRRRGELGILHPIQETVQCVQYHTVPPASK
jgi:hypothetical protein